MLSSEELRDLILRYLAASVSFHADTLAAEVNSGVSRSAFMATEIARLHELGVDSQLMRRVLGYQLVLAFHGLLVELDGGGGELAGKGLWLTFVDERTGVHAARGDYHETFMEFLPDEFLP
jgi:hypothetical protein